MLIQIKQILFLDGKSSLLKKLWRAPEMGTESEKKQNNEKGAVLSLILIV
jgi:hypothetical protein